MDTVVCIAAGIAALKLIDYGWTAWDTYQSGKVLADPNASRGEKLMAGLNVSLAIAFEALEPDDLIPVSVPLDDAGRKAVMRGAREAYEQGGEEGLQLFIRKEFGEHADEVLNHIGLGHSIDPESITLGRKTSKYLSNRGWSLDSIKELVKNPALVRKRPDIINKANGNPVTYFYRADGYYVVIDDITGEIVHVADTFDPNWMDPMTNAVIQPIGGQ